MTSLCVCVCECVWALTEKRLELLASYTMRSKGQRVMKCAAVMGMHVDMTAYVSSLVSHYYVTVAAVSFAEIFNGLCTA